MSDELFKVRRAHYQILAFLLKSSVAERFKLMAKDEVLSKFISSRIDPALLVDHHLQSEKEALDLAEMSLLHLVDSDRLNAELRRSAERIQLRLSQIFGPEVSAGFVSQKLIEFRTSWLRARLEFFKVWLSAPTRESSPADLARTTFHSSKKFQEHLERIFQTDQKLADEIVRETEPLFRFLMKKQLDYEYLKSKEIWTEFQTEIFRKPSELQ